MEYRIITTMSEDMGIESKNRYKTQIKRFIRWKDYIICGLTKEAMIFPTIKSAHIELEKCKNIGKVVKYEENNK